METLTRNGCHAFIASASRSGPQKSETTTIVRRSGVWWAGLPDLRIANVKRPVVRPVDVLGPFEKIEVVLANHSRARFVRDNHRAVLRQWRLARELRMLKLWPRTAVKAAGGPPDSKMCRLAHVSVRPDVAEVGEVFFSWCSKREANLRSFFYVNRIVYEVATRPKTGTLTASGTA